MSHSEFRVTLSWEFASLYLPSMSSARESEYRCPSLLRGLPIQPRRVGRRQPECERNARQAFIANLFAHMNSVATPLTLTGENVQGDTDAFTTVFARPSVASSIGSSYERIRPNRASRVNLMGEKLFNWWIFISRIDDGV